MLFNEYDFNGNGSNEIQFNLMVFRFLEDLEGEWVAFLLLLRLAIITAFCAIADNFFVLRMQCDLTSNLKWNGIYKSFSLEHSTIDTILTQYKFQYNKKVYCHELLQPDFCVH